MELIKNIIKFFLVIMIVVLIRHFLVTPIQVVGVSMKPYLVQDDVVISEKVSYKFKELKRFDIVVLNYKNPKYLVKRIIGLPGDKVEYSNNVLYINGKAIKENFLKKDVVTYDFKTEKKVPEDSYFVMGDNREYSTDSRDFGFISKDEIVGHAFIKIWPLDDIKILTGKKSNNR